MKIDFPVTKAIGPIQDEAEAILARASETQEGTFQCRCCGWRGWRPRSRDEFIAAMDDRIFIPPAGFIDSTHDERKCKALWWVKVYAEAVEYYVNGNFTDEENEQAGIPMAWALAGLRALVEH